MDNYKVLIINNHALAFPTESEIRSFMPLIQINEAANIPDCLAKLHAGEYCAIVVSKTVDKSDAERLGNAINFLPLKPSIIIIGEARFGISLFEDETNDLCIFVSNDENLRENLLYALDVAVKRFKLGRQISLLKEQLQQARINQNIVDLTLSYNSEINNILTAMIGNIQLILKSSSDIRPNTLEKLNKIDRNAQRILKMASCLIDIINAPSETLPIGDLQNQ